MQLKICQAKEGISPHAYCIQRKKAMQLKPVRVDWLQAMLTVQSSQQVQWHW